MTATAAQVGYYVDTTGIDSTELDLMITDMTAVITGQLDGSSITSTLSDALSALQTAVVIANKEPERVRTGQFETEAGKQVENWNHIIQQSLRFGRLYIDEA